MRFVAMHDYRDDVALELRAPDHVFDGVLVASERMLATILGKQPEAIEVTEAIVVE
ncbi:hypothetical protein [Paraburkholderia sp. SIMBA_030]|uniref:hypothetical protein n=1 Tax=Paraburkholderia sp. SIMBA_030 TaxID=3085773 RepID=UPI00397C74B0